MRKRIFEKALQRAVLAAHCKVFLRTRMSSSGTDQDHLRRTRRNKRFLPYNKIKEKITYE